MSAFVPAASPLIERFGFSAAKPLSLVLRKHVRLVSTLLAELVEGRALAVMDATATRYLQYFYPAVRGSPLIVPIPAPLGSALPAGEARGDLLSVGYLGRSDDLKLSALVPFIAHHLARVARTRPVEVLAITSEEGRAPLEAVCAAAGVRLRFQGFMPNAEARRLIRSSTDFAVAMGTSALDISASGHPCLVLDVAIRAATPPQERFRFLHESIDYNLGEYRDFPGYVSDRHSIEDVIRIVETVDQSEAARDYVASAHDPDRCFETLFAGIRGSQVRAATVGDLALRIDRSITATGRYYRWAKLGSSR